VIIGHDEKLAWGLTNMGADVSDFYLEKIVDGQQQVDDTLRPLTTRRETIKVAGGSDVTITVRTTSHGPVISDVIPSLDSVGNSPSDTSQAGGHYAVALAWTALVPGHTADAVLAMDTAADAADVAAAADLFEVPAQNIVFATTDGHIGYQAPGRVPVRPSIPGRLPSDGTWPMPGWDSRYDWRGWVASTDMPHVLDPPEGFIVTANQEVQPSGTGPFLTYDWDYGYRAQRIRDLLSPQIAAGHKLTVSDMAAIQNDQHSPYADMLVPSLLAVHLTGFDADGQRLLATWDRTMSPDSAAAAYFAAVWNNLLRLTFADDLPADHGPDGGSRWLEVVRSIIDDPSSSWWDDRTTPGIVEGRDDVLTRAMVAARAQLTAELGSWTSDWRWDKLHVVAPQHPVLGSAGIPSLVRGRVNPPARGVGGGTSSVDATAWDASTGTFGVDAGPSMRMVVDLADLNSSTWVNLTGTSGHPASNHYADQLDAWANGRTFPWPFTAAATGADAAERLTLQPGP
jgi:penicillin amidase